MSVSEPPLKPDLLPHGDTRYTAENTIDMVRKGAAFVAADPDGFTPGERRRVEEYQTMRHNVADACGAASAVNWKNTTRQVGSFYAMVDFINHVQTESVGGAVWDGAVDALTAGLFIAPVAYGVARAVGYGMARKKSDQLVEESLHAARMQEMFGRSSPRPVLRSLIFAGHSAGFVAACLTGILLTHQHKDNMKQTTEKEKPPAPVVAPAAARKTFDPHTTFVMR